LWGLVALGELELALGNVAAAVDHLERQRELAAELRITDVDLWPAAELVEAYVRLGRDDEAAQVSREYLPAAAAKGQPWPIARAHRCQGLAASEQAFTEHFERALAEHALTPDTFETARTHLAYGERLRRSRHRVRARQQLREAERLFDRLGARPWTDRARAELEATGERLRRGEPSTIDELTAQELQIAMMLGCGRTTREAAASLFLSPKTIEYHLRHVYLKLGVNSRDALAEILAAQSSQAPRQ
jgi:DNA-binding CsgD family transcriptional regulator